LFTDYLSINSALQRDSGENIGSSNALAAITLITAMSKPEEKERDDHPAGDEHARR